MRNKPDQHRTKMKQKTILSIGAGFPQIDFIKSLKEKGHDVKLVDLRWIAPLDMEARADKLEGSTHILIVDECRHTGSQSEAVAAGLHEHLMSPAKISRLTGDDTFIPLGPTATSVMPSKASIIEAFEKLVN